MVSGISAVAVRLMQAFENGAKRIVAEPKTTAPQQDFYTNSFWQVAEGDAPAPFFYVMEGHETVWGESPEALLATVNRKILESRRVFP